MLSSCPIFPSHFRYTPGANKVDKNAAIAKFYLGDSLYMSGFL